MQKRYPHPYWYSVCARATYQSRRGIGQPQNESLNPSRFICPFGYGWMQYLFSAFTPASPERTGHTSVLRLAHLTTASGPCAAKSTDLRNSEILIYSSMAEALWLVQPTESQSCLCVTSRTDNGNRREDEQRNSCLFCTTKALFGRG